MIPESFIHEVLARVDIVDLIDRHVRLKKAGANYMACCPFHSEKTPSFTVSPAKQFYHCFGCGAHGTAIGFLMEYQGLGFVDAIKELASAAGLPVPDTREGIEGKKPGNDWRTLHSIMAIAWNFYKESLKKSEKAKKYLKARGLSGEVAARFGLGYAPDGWQNLKAIFPDYERAELVQAGLALESENGRRYDRFRDRVMFPIIGAKGEVIGFGGRVIGEGTPKYLNSPETPLFEKGRELFGLPQARQALRDENLAIVVEGYMDVVALAQHGISNALATLGTATTPQHAQKLLRQVDSVVFCFDGDAAGRKAAWRALENTLDFLPDNKSVAFAFLPESEDPDSFVRQEGKEAFLRFIRKATPLSDYLIFEIKKHCDLASAEGRARLITEAKPLLARLAAPSLRLQMVKRLANESGLTQAEVERLCGIRGYTPPQPKKPKRVPPSLSRRLLRLALCQPERVKRIPLEKMPPGAERDALTVLAEILPGLPPDSNLAQIMERLRGHPLEMFFVEAQSDELMRGPAEQEILDEQEKEFEDVLIRFAEEARGAGFSDLQEKARLFGVSGLSAEEKAQYLTLLTRQEN
ncbi:MAG: DNA primase [Zoogloeaceae bacterium]|jgi:DNA primase|nr:DNA primase [Zoogloeaceae bacterium]